MLQQVFRAHSCVSAMLTSRNTLLKLIYHNLPCVRSHVLCGLLDIAMVDLLATVVEAQAQRPRGPLRARALPRTWATLCRPAHVSLRRRASATATACRQVCRQGGEAVSHARLARTLRCERCEDVVSPLLASGLRSRAHSVSLRVSRACHMHDHARFRIQHKTVL